MTLTNHEMKRCTRCGQIFPRTSEYFHSQGPRKPLRAVCIACVNTGRRERRTNREYPVDHRAKAAAAPCAVRVVEDAATRKRRALYYWEDGPGVGEVWIGVGYDLLETEDSA